MRRLACLMCLFLVVGCDSKDSENGQPEPSAQPEPEPQPQPEPLPEPYEGELNHDRFEGVGDLVNPFDEWERAYALVAAQLGAHSAEDDGHFFWAFGDEAGCTQFSMERMDSEQGPQVGTISHPSRIDRMIRNQWEACMMRTPGGIPEDPNAPGPPGVDTAVGVQDVLNGVENAYSRWVGQEVRVRGVLTSVSRAEGGTVTVTVSIGARADDLLTSIGCQLADIEADVDRLQGTALEAVGTLTSTFGGSLEDCSITFVAEQ